MINNVDILQYLEVERFINEGYTIQKLYNNIIYDYDAGNLDNYISVEVSESEKSTGSKLYTVMLKMSLNNEERIDEMSSTITEIINKLYPSRRKFSNTPFRITDNFISADNYGYTPVLSTVSLNNNRSSRLHRAITFELW